MKKIFFISLVLLSIKLFSQEDEYSNIIFCLNYKIGQILLPGSSNIPKSDNSKYIDINILKHTTGTKHWHKNYKYPEMGFGFAFGNLGNDTVYGNIIAAYPTWVIKSFAKNKIGLDIKLGIGFAYFDKPYDRIKNIENELVSTNFSNFTKIGIGLRYSPFHNTSLFIGYEFIHCSNAHTKIPNYGLNDLTYSFGLKYSLNNKNNIINTTSTYDNYDSVSTPIKLNFRIGYGINEFAPTRTGVGGPKYPIYSINPYFSKRLSKINEMQVGLGLIYYVGYNDYLIKNDLYVNNRFNNSIVLYTSIGHEFLISKFGFVTQFHTNIYNPFYHKITKKQEEQYGMATSSIHFLGIRLGFQYYPLKTCFDQKNIFSLGLFLKTNVEKADFVEFTTAYKF